MRTKLLYPLYSFFQRNDAAFYVSLLLFDKNEDVSKELAALHDTRVILVKPGREFRNQNNPCIMQCSKFFTHIFIFIK
jgi:hypothetical protein